jgi:hypothetical protein
MCVLRFHGVCRLWNGHMGMMSPYAINQYYSTVCMLEMLRQLGKAALPTLWQDSLDAQERYVWCYISVRILEEFHFPRKATTRLGGKLTELHVIEKVTESYRHRIW